MLLLLVLYLNFSLNICMKKTQVRFPHTPTQLLLSLPPDCLFMEILCYVLWNRLFLLMDYVLGNCYCELFFLFLYTMATYSSLQFMIVLIAYNLSFGLFAHFSYHVNMFFSSCYQSFILLKEVCLHYCSVTLCFIFQLENDSYMSKRCTNKTSSINDCFGCPVSKLYTK